MVRLDTITAIIAITVCYVAAVSILRTDTVLFVAATNAIVFLLTRRRYRYG